MSVEVDEGQQLAQPQRSLDAMVWVLIVLLLLPAVVALQLIPWAQGLLSWTLPAIAVGGFVIGVLLAVATSMRRWWWVLLSTTLLLGAAIALGTVLIGHGLGAVHPDVGQIILGAFCAGLTAVVPWLVLRAKQAWLAVVVVWLAVMGAWGAKLSTRQMWWLIWLLAISLALLGMSHLREEARIWRAKNLQRLGPVLWPSARLIISSSLLVAAVGLVPLGLANVGMLSSALKSSPFGSGGPLSYTGASGTPVAVLGAPLTLDAPNVGSDQIILSYDVINGPIVMPPLVGATLDTFDGATWTLGPTVATVPATNTLAQPANAQQLTTRFTIYNLPQTQNGSMLLGFDQPLSFSVPTQVDVLDAGAPTAVTIAGWKTPHPLAKGVTYTCTSAVLTGTTIRTGTFSTAFIARMTQVPSTLDPSVAATAQQWTSGAHTPTAQAQALLDALTRNIAFDARAIPPKGADAVAWTIAHKRANTLVLTTTYIEMARTLGLPMRLAEGYLPGHYDPKSHRTFVRASDATVWAQLAIPGAGWLDFFPAADEVTVTIPSKIIYTGVTPTPTPQATAAPTHSPAQQNQQQAQVTPNEPQAGSAWIVAALVLFAVVLLALAIVTFVRWRWLRYGSHLAPLTRFFARLGLLSRLAGIRLHASDTAFQATEKVTVVVPAQRQTLTALNSVYERSRYGPPDEQNLMPNLQEHWQRLSRVLWRLVITKGWRRPQARTHHDTQRHTTTKRG